MTPMVTARRPAAFPPTRRPPAGNRWGPGEGQEGAGGRGQGAGLRPSGWALLTGRCRGLVPLPLLPVPFLAGGLPGTVLLARLPAAAVVAFVRVVPAGGGLGGSVGGAA